MATPAQLGYRMPAEWEPHQATWLSWPHKESSWPGKFEQIEPVYARMVAALATSETVHINACDDDLAARARAHLEEAGATGDIRLHDFYTNDAWCRDHGAIFVVKEEGMRGDPSSFILHPSSLAATDWEYNAWGGKYPPSDLDNQIPARMAEYLNVPRFKGEMVLEGGSIDVNGQGLLLTSEQCLLNPNRNPELSREQIEARLRAFLGVQKILWLGEGIIGDDTDGHVDDISRFVAADTILTAVEDDPQDENYPILQENLRRLQLMTGLDGRPLRILSLPMPPPVVYEGQRLPASYANFYIANRIVLVPFYSHPNDQRAAAIIQACFPERRVVGIDCTDIIWGLGAWHCLTQQVPAV
ncbi:agmatine deiminase family protein [Oscillochloris sp. ZM17-4]|uniref:agmatine deiminase family protein n=1 Tax=Oscillochloris sp. ZM17-4 TaxID=2866714 RepID=UPI001C73ADAE|nr:agmatine deiminase family protein [Oscillochloris sp. ZM17-4]MBX0326519.1 agmatine deiminase family protein [Oscillochloris sp. ZM17-4]